MALFKAVRQMLADYHLNDYVASRKQALVTIHNTHTVEEALQVLADSRILSVPVLDKDQEYVGCLSVGDVLKFAINSFAPTLLSEEWVADNGDVLEHELSRVWKNIQEEYIAKILHAGDVWYRGDVTSTLLDVVLQGFSIQEAEVHHRVVLCDSAKEQATSVQERTTVINITPGSEALNATGLRPVTLVTQSDIVKLVWENQGKFADLFNLTIEELDLYLGVVLTVPASLTTLEVFAQMERDHKSSLGITDNGKLVANVSVSDLRKLTAENYHLLLKPVGEFILAVRGVTSLQEISLIAVQPSSTFAETLTALVSNALHRVYVVDAERTPVGIVTLTDVLRMVSK